MNNLKINEDHSYNFDYDQNIRVVYETAKLNIGNMWNVWEEINFNNEVENIEDRIWAGEILKKNYKIKYTPKAPVYHYHGIHQSGNSKRLEGVTKIIEKISYGRIM